MITLQPSWMQASGGFEGVRILGAIASWPKHGGERGGAPTHMPSSAFVPRPLREVSSVIRMLVSSRWFVAEKNDGTCP